MPGPEVFRGTRLEVEPGEVYAVGCPWCPQTVTVIGPEIIDADRLRQFHALHAPADGPGNPGGLGPGVVNRRRDPDGVNNSRSRKGFLT